MKILLIIAVKYTYAQRRDTWCIIFILWFTTFTHRLLLNDLTAHLKCW